MTKSPFSMTLSVARPCSGAARSVLLLGTKDDHSDEVYLAHVKCSLAPNGQTLVFTKENNWMYFEGVSEISANQRGTVPANAVRNGSEDPCTAAEGQKNAPAGAGAGKHK